MKTREMIDYVIEEGDREKMYKLNDMLNELICDLKISNPKLFKEYKKELYELAYGKVILKDKAIEIVNDMTPYGEHYDMEMVERVVKSYNLKHSVVDVYLVLNSIYNDYCEVFGDSEEANETYVNMTKAWLNDKDAIEDKVYCYFMTIPKEKED